MSCQLRYNSLPDWLGCASDHTDKSVLMAILAGQKSTSSVTDRELVTSLPSERYGEKGEESSIFSMINFEWEKRIEE